ncbi:MAG: ribosome silencing factor [Atopostipes suicloacalis]|nr:ribosome silencing factor [Atopostipes suicloacalis]
MENKAKELLESVIKAIDGKRAKDITVLDMKNISIMSDYNVITHASNSRLINAIAEAALEAGKKQGYEAKGIEGKQKGNWLLIDLGAVIIHIFSEEERKNYQLEDLWSDADSVDVSDWLVD